MTGLREMSERTRAMLRASAEVLAHTGNGTRIYPVAAPRGAEGYRRTWVAYRHTGTADEDGKDGTALLRPRVELVVAAPTLGEALDTADACRRALKAGDDCLSYGMTGYDEDYDEAMELYKATLTMEGLSC